MEFNTEYEIYYKLYDGFDNRIYMNWIGKHTVGQIGCRGTRLWIHPETMFYCKYNNSYGDIEIFNDYPLDIYNNMNTSYDPLTFLGDDFSIRFQDLDELLSLLENRSSDVRHFHFYDQFDYLQNDLYLDGKHEFDFFKEQLINHIKPNSVYMHELFTGKTNIGIIYKYNELLKELTDVYSIANSYNVTFEWI